ncbi:MAG: SRPBCC family protein [Anaerolineae bacterium]|jgi:uncharacterized membrane protein
MIEFKNRIVIDRPVEEVFAFVADFENVPKWNYYVLEVNKTSAGPLGVGTTYHQTRKTDEQDFGVIEYEPTERVVVKTLPHAQPAFEMRFMFQPLEGGTQMTDAWKLDTGGPGLLERLGRGKVKQAVKENLVKLKELLETGSVQLQDGRTAVR